MAVTWSTTDLAANVTLSGSNLTATMSSATQGAVRANTSFAAGKLYYEAFIANTTGALWSVGWSNSTQSLTAALGATTNSVVFQPFSTRAFFNNVSFGTLSNGAAVSANIGIALDLTNKKIWFRINGGYWNNSKTDDPGTNTGGYSLSTIAAGPYFPIFGSNGSGASITANFGVVEFSYPIPSGFSALDTQAQAYAASSKLIGYGFFDADPQVASASKLIGYNFYDADPQVVSVSKLIGYVWLEPLPFNQLDWPLPPRLPRRRMGDVWGVNPAIIPPVPVPQVLNFDWPAPRRRPSLPPGFTFSLIPPTSSSTPPFAYLLMASL